MRRAASSSKGTAASALGGCWPGSLWRSWRGDFLGWLDRCSRGSLIPDRCRDDARASSVKRPAPFPLVRSSDRLLSGRAMGHRELAGYGPLNPPARRPADVARGDFDVVSIAVK